MSKSEVKSWSSSAETIGSNQDILTEILIRIPAKPLVKLKAVSKQWLSLIADPQFCVCHARYQRNHNPTPNALLLKIYHAISEFHVVPLKNTQGPCEAFSISFEDQGGMKIQHSCNGLLICTSVHIVYKSTSVHVFYKPIDYDVFNVILNPTTKQFKRLVLPSYKFDFEASILSLAFDPSKSPYYKVISLRVFYESKNQYEIDVYSSETESWSQARIRFQWPSEIDISTSVFFRGAIHWYSIAATSPYFDLDSKTLKTMSMPPVLFMDQGSWEFMYFGESRDHLLLVVSQIADFGLEFDVLEMATDYSGWSVRYHVDLRPTRTVFPELEKKNCRPYSVLSVICAEKEEESIAVIYVEGGAISYNLYDGTSYKLCDLGNSGEYPDFGLIYHGGEGYEFFESLVSV